MAKQKKKTKEQNMAKAKQIEEENKALSYTDLIALGFSPEVAKGMTDYSDSSEGSGLPAPQLKFNYDKEDIIGSAVPKGNLITGWKVDNQALVVKETGLDLGNEVEIVVIASAYQNSFYDVKTKKVTVSSNIFKSSYDNDLSRDLKTGVLISDLKKANSAIKFNNILALLVNVEGTWTPHIFYLKGTALYEWNVQIEKSGILKDNIVGGTFYTIKTKRIPTSNQPAWIFDIVSTRPRVTSDIIAAVKETSALFDKWLPWVAKVNSGAEANKAPDSAQAAPAEVEVPDDTEINFD